MVDILAYASTAVCLGAYLAAAVRPNRVRWFNWANALCWVPIGWSALNHRAVPSLIITVAFGVIGVWGLARAQS